jgi:signal peptide peptidase SppA
MASSSRKSLFALGWLKRFRRDRAIVPVVRLAGVIAVGSTLRPGLSLAAIDDTLQRAFKMRAKAVALAINSPGGSPVQSALIHDRIRQLAKKHDKPVIAFCEDVAASGGYWLALAGDEIYADQGSIVGSIGVVSAGFGFVESIKKLGIERRVHTAGDAKVILDPFQSEKKADVIRLKALQADIHESFKAHVRARRGARLKGDEKELFSGAFWTAGQARELGLIDGIGHLHQVLEEKFGADLEIRPARTSGGWGLRRLFAPRGEAARIDLAFDGLAEELFAATERRALWQRFGL